MPPGDTTIILTEYNDLPEPVQRIMDSIAQAGNYQKASLTRAPNYPAPEWVMFLVVLFFVGLSAYLYIFRPARRHSQRRLKLPAFGSSERGLAEMQYDQWLSKYNPYYNALPVELKNRFLERTIRFMESKEFRFHSMVAEDYIPVLISGAAVQLTFGLPNYQLDYFDVIHVMRKEYVLSIDNETYYGHVSKNGIHISWAHFMDGYNDYADSANLGLHEMAHALSFDCYLGYADQHDMEFRHRLNGFVKEAVPILRTIRANGHHMYDAYDLSNFDEFWASSVEIFFENPTAFKEKLPALYLEISELLNQDPLYHNKLMDPYSG